MKEVEEHRRHHTMTRGMRLHDEEECGCGHDQSTTIIDHEHGEEWCGRVIMITITITTAT